MTAPRRRTSIRSRLALLYTGLLVAALAIFGSAMYVVLSDQLYRSFDERLLANAHHVADALTQDVSPSGSLQPTKRLIDQFASTGGRVVVLDPSGATLADSAAPGGVVIDITQADIAAAERHANEIHEVSGDGDVLRLTVEPVSGAGGSIAGYVAWADSTRPLRDVLGSVLVALLVGGAVLALFALVLGLLLARRALAPVAEVTDTARAISLSGDFAARVEVGPTGDEVGDLAVAFNEMLAALEDSHHTLQRFLGDASHQLRTPLTTIRANLELAARPDLPKEERAAILADARDEAERMGRLIGDLLSLARAEAGVRLELVPVELDAVLVESVRRARQAASHVRMTVTSVEPAVVEGDRDRLHELFGILLDNAARYTPAGGSVTADLHVVDSRAEVHIADTGIGLDEADRSRLFERLYRGTRARAMRPAGTGLGLAIARWIVEAHAGQIDLVSRDGGGTVVSVDLPVRPH